MPACLAVAPTDPDLIRIADRPGSCRGSAAGNLAVARYLLQAWRKSQAELRWAGKACRGDRHGSRWIRRIVIFVQITRQEGGECLLASGIRVKRASIDGIREVEVRLYRIGVLALGAARLMIVPDRGRGYVLDARGDGLFVDAIVELVLQRLHAGPFAGAQPVQDAGAQRRKYGKPGAGAFGKRYG